MLPQTTAKMWAVILGERGTASDHPQAVEHVAARRNSVGFVPLVGPVMLTMWFIMWWNM
jgi:hypothetical protein